MSNFTLSAGRGYRNLISSYKLLSRQFFECLQVDRFRFQCSATLANSEEEACPCP